jgi:hypothetical protein
MLKLFFILLALVAVDTAPTTAAAPCEPKCKAQLLGGRECASLSYYMKSCTGCEAKIGRQCAQAFCGNFPNSCTKTPLGKKPLKNLSTIPGDEADICTAPLFSHMTYGEPGEERDNSNVSIIALNTLDYKGLKQTGGGLPRALNTIRLYAANYLVADAAINKKKIGGLKPAQLKAAVEDWFKLEHGIDTKDPDQVTFKNLNYLAEQIRVKIFELKGIDTQKKLAHFEEHEEEGKEMGYEMTVSKLGCHGEQEHE